MSKEVTPHNYLFIREGIHPPVRLSGMSAEKHMDIYAQWHRKLTTEQKDSHTLLTAQVFGLLGIKSYDQVQTIIQDPEVKQQALTRVTHQLGNVFGISDPEVAAQRFRAYSTHANNVRDYLQNTVSYHGCPNLEMINEIRAIDDPASLLLITLDGGWPARERWDAKLKLQLMYLYGLIDRRQRETDIKTQFNQLVFWMRERVFNHTSLADDDTGVFLVSTHDPKDWSCTEARWIKGTEESFKLQTQPFQRKTHLLLRNIKANSYKGINAYYTIRDKSPDMKLLKMLRKKAENPAVAVDDDTGFLVVVNSISDVRRFVYHLISCGYQSNDPILVEEVTDTLSGGEYKGNAGSSPKLRQMKFFIRIASKIRSECIIHTPKSYAEHLYRRGVSHLEFTVNRLFDSGVVDMVFPKEHHPYFDTEEARKQSIRRIRSSIEYTEATC